MAVNTDAIAAELERVYPNWWVWVSDTGTWWASRRRQLTPADRAAGRVPYLRAASGVELQALLSDEEQE